MIGVLLLTSGGSNFTRMLGAALILISIVGTWANRLAGNTRGVRFPEMPTGGPRPQPATRLSSDGRAFFSLLGMIAKADGRVSETEIEAIEPLLPDGPVREHAIAAFREGRDSPQMLEPTVAQLFSGVSAGQVDGLFDLFCRLALVDGGLSPPERDLLERIERLLFGTTVRTARYAGQWTGGASSRSDGGRSRRSRTASRPQSATDPHKVMGLPRPTTRAAIKKRYRELAKQHHPDRVRGRGVPEEAVRAAEQQMRDINVARDELMAIYSD